MGFLRYFQVKQLPNFLLASPILSLALCSIVYYVKLWPEVFFSLGLRASSVDSKFIGSSVSTGPEGHISTAGNSEYDTPNVLKGAHVSICSDRMSHIIVPHFLYQGDVFCTLESSDALVAIEPLSIEGSDI